MNYLSKTLCILLLLWPMYAPSQQFWTLTNEFWGGPKTGITLVDDSVLFVSTTTGILKSTNEGDRFEQVLSASAIYSIYASSGGIIYAGGKGKVYLSEDSGNSWDSVSINSAYPVTQIIENSNKFLFAITFEFNEGDGVFYSDDNGRTWVNRNNGIGSLPGCKKIAADKNGRLYLMVSDLESTGNGGLFISENQGLLWEKISIQPDLLNGPAKITNPTGLSISPHDSVYISFYGVVTNYLVQLNLYKSIDDVISEKTWKAFYVHESSNWWEDWPLNDIHFSRSGDCYSSFTQMLSHGATYYLKANNKSWDRIDYGLGSSEDGWRREQFFAENSAGRIFMVQYLDERIYTTDKSLTTDINPPVKYPPSINVYPNPAKAGSNIYVQFPAKGESGEVTIYDFTGRKILQKAVSTNTIEDIRAPKKAGVYILTIRFRNEVGTEKIHVY